PGANPFDADTNIAAGMKLTTDNTKSLQKSLGRAPTPGEIYAAHQLGVGGAKALLRAPDALPMASLVAQYDPANASATVQGNGLSGMTVGQVKAHYEQVMQSNMAKTAGYANAPEPGQQADPQDMPAFFRDLTPPQRQAMLSHAQSLLHKDDAEGRILLQAQIKDTMEAYQRGEQAPNPPTMADYAKHYPAAVAAKMYAEQQGWQQFGSDVGAFKTMPYAEQQALLASRQAQPGEGFAAASERADALGKAATFVNQQRQHDQIAYAQTTGGGITKAID